MADPPIRSWLDRLLSACLTLLVSALALHWAWQLVQPLLPIIVALAVIGFVVLALVRASLRRREFL